MNKIQSISDIITNSSSEVFIIDSEHHSKIADFLKDVCDVFGWGIDDLMSFDSADQDGVMDGVLSTRKIIFLFGVAGKILFLIFSCSL